MNREIEQRVKKAQDANIDFSMNSINIFDFMQEDERKKKEDEEALDEMAAKFIQHSDLRTRRDKVKVGSLFDPAKIPIMKK